MHGTGLGRPPLLGGKDGGIEGISSLLNLPLQPQPHLAHSIPPNMSSNPAMGLTSPSSHFLESSGIRSNFPQSHSSGSKARYKCSLCFKEVRLLRDLRAHMATKHNLEKDFSCSVCGTGFTYKHNLFVHLRTVHKLNDRLVPSALTWLEALLRPPIGCRSWCRRGLVVNQTGEPSVIICTPFKLIEC